MNNSKLSPVGLFVCWLLIAVVSLELATACGPAATPAGDALSPAPDTALP